MISRYISDSVIVTDLQGSITYWNEGARAIFGYTAQEMIGNSTAVLYPEIVMAQARQSEKHFRALVENNAIH